MTKNLLFVLGILFFSCNSKQSSEKGNETDFNFTYTIDTVMVDAGEHFFFLNWGLRISDVTPDGKYLINLNPQTLLMEIVDLDNLKFYKTVQLEKEGPNGVGALYFQGLQVLNSGNIFLKSQRGLTLISPDGKLLDSYDFNKTAFKGYELKEDEQINYMGVFSADGKKYAGVLESIDFEKPAKGIVLIDMESNSLDYIPLDMFTRVKQFQISLQMGDAPGIATGEFVHLSFEEDNLIISSSAYNEVYQYDLTTDSLSHFSFESNLTANEKVLNYTNQATSMKEWEEANQAKNEQVSFSKFLKLPANNLFWRITTDKDRMIGDSLVYKHILTLFDQDFKVLKEQKLEDFHSSDRSFIKDQTIYNYINIDDELAFVRLKPSFVKD